MQHIARPDASATSLVKPRATDTVSVTAERDTLYDNGFQPIAVRERAKGGGGALLKGWPDTRGRIPYIPSHIGTGLLMLDHTCCIDADIGHGDNETADIVRACAFYYFGETPCVQTRANSAHFKLLYQPAVDADGTVPPFHYELMPTPPDEKKQSRVEYLTGKKYIGALLTHESGAPFEWKSGSPLIIKREWLPIVSQEMIDAFFADLVERFPRPRLGPQRSTRQRSGKTVSKWGANLHDPIPPTDVEAFFLEVPNSFELFPSYDDYYRLPAHAHGVICVWRDQLAAMGKLRPEHLAFVVNAMEERLRQAWISFANQQPQDEKSTPERKWEDTANPPADVTGALFIVKAQEAVWMMPSRRPRPITVTDPTTGQASTITDKEAAGQLFEEVRQLYRIHRSKDVAFGKTLHLLLSAEPAVARRAFTRVAMSVLARTTDSERDRTSEILIEAAERLFGAGLGAFWLVQAVNKLDATSP